MLSRFLWTGLAIPVTAVVMWLGGSWTHTVPDGSVGGAGAVRADEPAPFRINCLWALPDMRPGYSDDAFPSPDVHYANLRNPRAHDHDMSLAPDAGGDRESGPQSPCAGPENGTSPGQRDDARHLTQILPNRDDQPSPAQLQLWAAVSHPDGGGVIEGVNWTLDDPSGSIMARVEGTAIAPADCMRLGLSHVDGSMWQAAVATGQVSATAADDSVHGLASLCLYSRLTLYHGVVEISSADRCGEYRLTAHAASPGQVASLRGYVDVICFHHLEMDFGTLDWGEISPGVSRTLHGDFDWNPPADTAPTLRNSGNDALSVGIRFQGLRLEGGTADDPEITSFSAALARSESAPSEVAQHITAGATAWFDTTLCPGDRARLDLAIHPPAVLTPGTYGGLVGVLARSADAACYGPDHDHS